METAPAALAVPSAAAPLVPDRLHGAGAEDVLAFALDRFAGRLALVTSLQVDGLVLLDLAHRLAAGRLDALLRVVTLDTGRLHQETYELVDRVRRRYGVDVEMVFPEAAAVEELVRRSGPNLFYASPEARRECCRVRKVEPLRRALEPFAAWLTGLRRDQSPERRRTPKVAVDPLDPAAERLKICPLAEWSEERVWDYVRRRSVPYHPLYDHGYQTIGCAPCSRPARPAEPPRAGRWWWERDGARECGLHVVNGGRG